MMGRITKDQLTPGTVVKTKLNTEKLVVLDMTKSVRAWLHMHRVKLNGEGTEVLGNKFPAVSQSGVIFIPNVSDVQYIDHEMSKPLTDMPKLQLDFSSVREVDETKVPETAV